MLSLDGEGFGAEEGAGLFPRDALRRVGGGDDETLFGFEEVGGGVQSGSNSGEKFVASGIRSDFDRRGHRSGCGRAPASAGRGKRCVADQGGNRRNGQTELFGGHDRDDGTGSGPNVLGAAFDDDLAVGMDVDLGACSAASSAPRCRADAEAASENARLTAGGLTSIPSDQIGSDVVLAVTGGMGIVFLAKSNGVDAEEVGEVVEGRFDAKRGLGMSGSSHSAGVAGVDVDVFLLDAPRADVIDIGSRNSGSRTDTAGAIGVQFEGGEGAVFFGADLDGLDGGGTVSGDHTFLATGEHESNGGFGDLGQSSGEDGFFAGAEFAAESAAHKVADDAYFVGFEVEGSGQTVAHAEDALGGSPNGQFGLVVVPLGDDAVGFEAGVNLNLSGIGSFDDRVGFGESGVGIALDVRSSDVDVRASFAASRRSIGFQGVFFSDDEGIGFVFDADRLDGVLGDVFADRGDGGDKLARIATEVPFVFDFQDGFDAAHFFGVAEVYSKNFRMGIGADGEASHEGFWGEDVIGIEGFAGYFGEGIHARDAFSDQGHLIDGFPRCCGHWLGSFSHAFCGGQCRFEDTRIGTASADVPRNGSFDVFEGGISVFVQKGRHRHDETGRAETTHQGVVFDEGLLNRVEVVAVSESFDGGDFLSLGVHGEDRAGVDGFSVEVDGASAAGGSEADRFRSGQTETIAQHVEESSSGFDAAESVNCPVDLEGDGAHRDAFDGVVGEAGRRANRRQNRRDNRRAADAFQKRSSGERSFFRTLTRILGSGVVRHS